MLQFEGDKNFSQSPDVVWSQLVDPAFLVTCIPDMERVIKAEGDDMIFVLRPGLAFMRGNLEVNGKVQDKVKPTAVSYEIHSKGIGSSSLVVVALTLAAAGTGTQVHWNAEVKALGGLLKLIPGGLIRGAAQKVIGDLWNAVEKKIQESA